MSSISPIIIPVHDNTFHKHDTLPMAHILHCITNLYLLKCIYDSNSLSFKFIFISINILSPLSSHKSTVVTFVFGGSDILCICHYGSVPALQMSSCKDNSAREMATSLVLILALDQQRILPET